MNQKTSEIFPEREFKFVELINIFLACLIFNSIWQWRLMRKVKTHARVINRPCSQSIFCALDYEDGDCIRHDIAVLKLLEPITLDNKIHPICLPWHLRSLDFSKRVSHI